MSERKEFNAFEALKNYDPCDIRQSAEVRQIYTSTASSKYSKDEWQEYDEAKQQCKNDWREWDIVKNRNPKFEQMAREYMEALDAFDRHCEAHENNKKQ